MAVTDYAGVFRRRILQNVAYWVDFLAEHGQDMAVLDGEREGIFRAMGYALDVAEARLPAYEVMTQFSPHLERRGTWAGWNPLLEQAARQAEANGDLAAAVTLSTLLARLCQRQSRLAETIRHYRRVIRLARRLDDAFGLGRACTNLGYLYVEQGRWWRAEILCCFALAIFERIGSDHGRAHTENHLGRLYTLQGLWEQARQRLDRACALWQERDDPHGLMRGFINQSALCLDREHPNPDEALAFLEKALQQARLTGEESETGNIYVNMAFAYWLKGDLIQTEVMAQQGEAILRRFSNSVGLAGLWDSLGLIYLDQGKWESAAASLNAALAMWRSLGNKFAEFKTLLYLVKYELRRGYKQQAAAKLAEMETLIGLHLEKTQRRPLLLLLAEYRRNLAEDSTESHGE